MNEFDQFMKHGLRIKNYVRYTDDFVVVDKDKSYLENLIPKITTFLKDNLRLELHPSKVSIRKFSQGIDFLGYITLPHHVLLRTKTKNRIFKKLERAVEEYRNGHIDRSTLNQSLQSYLGVLSHADAHDISEDLKNRLWF